MLWGFHTQIQQGKQAVDHRHDLHELVICLDDQGSHTVNGKIYPFCRGRTFFLPAGVPHCVIPPPERVTEIMFVCFSLDTLLEVSSLLCHQLVVQLIKGSYPWVGGIHDEEILCENLTITERLKNLVNRIDLHSRIQVGAWLSLLFSNHIRSIYMQNETVDDSKSKRIALLCQNLQMNPSFKESLDQVAKRMGMSRATFTRVFRSYTGYSFVHYLNIQRIHLAMQWLATSNEEIAYIAAQLGYSNLGYFYRIFKRIVGISPLKYRRKVQMKGYALPLLPDFNSPLSISMVNEKRSESS